MPDGTGDAPTIQAGIDSAGIGDTVLVAPGLYPDSLHIDKPDITLVSESGAASTTIMASAKTGIILVSANNVSISGFAITNPRSNGVYCLVANLSGIEVAYNVICGCYAGIAGPGGDYATTLHAHHNVVRDNRGLGIIACGLVDSNTVSDNQGTGITGCARVLGNVIERNQGSDLGNGRCTAVQACYEVVDNTIRDNYYGYVSSACSLIEGNIIADNEGGMLTSGSEEIIRGNLITGNSGMMGAVRCYSTSVALIENNTICDNWYAGIDLTPDEEGGEPHPTIRNNIIAGNGCGIYDQSGEIEVFCNDIWGNRDGPYYGAIVHHSDILEDPRFCGAVAQDYSLCSNSPCASSPCGLMGAFGVRCSCGVGTQPTTWGAIKAIYK
jgi:hypothetical protein